MIDALFTLATVQGIDYQESLRKSLQRPDGVEETMIRQLETELENDLFSYRIICGQIQNGTAIGKPFVVHKEQNYFLVKYTNGVYQDNTGIIALEKYLGCRYFEIREIAKQKSVDELVSVVINWTPVWSALRLLLTPFALVTPLYANMFNTHLVYANSIFTLLIVSLFFLALFLFEFFAKKIINELTRKEQSRSSMIFERYLLQFTPCYRQFSAVQNLQAVAQYRKMVWDSMPAIASDILSFIILFVTLGVFVGWLIIYFLLFYALIFALPYLYRSRLYQHLIDQEKGACNVLKLRIANSSSPQNIPFINRYNLFSKYLSSFKVAQRYDDNVANFTVDWGDPTQLISFLALIVLLLISFIAITNARLNPAYMIVLLIVSARLSGLMTAIVTRHCYLSAGLMHLRHSMAGLFGNVSNSVNQVGIALDTLNKIRVSGVTLRHDEQTLLSHVDLTLHKGVLYGLKGPVGSGKSTLLRALIGLEQDIQGKIEYDGHDITLIDSRFFAQKVSFLTAETRFFSGTLYDNFLYKNCTNARLIKQVLRECFGNRMFDYQTLYVDNIDNIPMSTGQRRKLLFMLALMDRASLYVFDEILVNLCREDVVRAMNLLRSFLQDSIIILSSHHEPILDACDVVFEIEHQKVMQVG